MYLFVETMEKFFIITTSLCNFISLDRITRITIYLRFY